MSKVLLVGPPRTGKTQEILKQFQQSLQTSRDVLFPDSFLILPSAEHTDRMISLLMQRGTSGFFHRRITTFSRLVSETFGVGEEGLASNVTRTLILRDLLENRDWGYFNEVRQTSGFLNRMMALLSELKESLISCELFRERMNEMKRLEPHLAVKYEALASFYEAYEEALAQKGLRDRQDNYALYLEQKKQGARSSRKFRSIWLDGFFDFSPLQLAYLSEVCEISENVTITLTCDVESKRAELFEMIQETENALLELGFEKKSLKSKSKPTALSYLTQNIFSPTRPKQKPSSDERLKIFEAIGMEGEIEMMAREVQTLTQAGDYRMSDFAILFRQVGDYASLVRSVFGRYDIPVEIHERERLGFAPLIEVVVRLLKLFREDWQRSDLMSFLKSSYVRFLGLIPKDYEWVSSIEHQAMSKGVLKEREAWKAAFPEELKLLFELEDKLRNAHSLESVKVILFNALETLGILIKQDSLEEHVRRDAASLQRLISILDEIESSLSQPNQASIPFTFEGFADRFFRLADLDLYSLHERDKNRVQVYSISLARQKEYRVVFLAGLLEKKFPLQIKEDPLMSDWERGLFKGSGTQGVLKEKLPRQSLERYLFYLGLSRSKEKLVLTYPRLNLEGQESLPSYYVEEVRDLFSNPVETRCQELARPYPSLHEVMNERELEMALMGDLWLLDASRQAPTPKHAALAGLLWNRPESMRRIQRSFYQVKAELTDKRIQETDAFHALKTSPTRLESYGKCPFHYYADYVLQLEDPEEDVNVMTRGIILHQVLEYCFREWCNREDVLKNPVQAKKRAMEHLEDAFREHPLRLAKKYQYELEIEGMREMLSQFLDYELERLQSSQLKPAYFEYDFGGFKSDSPPLVIEDGERKILIRGKIDRIDVHEKQKKAVVIDYKRTAQFKKADLEFGTALQLPIYNMVLERFLKLKPAGGELFSIRDCEKKGFYHEEALDLFPEISRRRMILKEAEFRELLGRSTFFIKQFSRGMEEMKIDVKPRDCSDYCPYPSVCRIEKWRKPMIIEQIKKEDAACNLPKPKS